MHPKRFYTSLLCTMYLIYLNAQHIDLNNNRELFIDHYLVDKFENTTLKMHSPIDRGVAFYFDKPWEGQSSNYVTIIKDNNLYRAYYRGVFQSKTEKAKQVTCIAESKDGINWYKPELNLFKVDGSSMNNIILLYEGDVSHNFSPFIDLNPHSTYKYKGIGGKEKDGLFVYQSNDGITWKKMQDTPFYTDGNFDTQNVVFWSPEHKSYLLFFRKWVKGTNGLYRSIAVSTSEDFKTWKKYKLLNFGNTPIENLYTNQIEFYYRAPQILIGIGARLFEGKKAISESVSKQIKVKAKYFNDCSDVYLMSSRNSVDFDRTFMESFMRPGLGYNNWTSRTNYPALHFVETSNEELSVYRCENYMQPDAHLRRYSIRIDGFSSINAGYNGGSVLTKPLKFQGKTLEINYSTSAAGEIQIELLDENNKVINGFSRNDCDNIVGDEISRIVSWKNKSDLSSLKNKVVKMKFYLKDADVFSFKYN